MLIRSRRTSDNQKIKKILLIVVGVFIVAMLAPSAVRFVAGIVLYPIIQVENWFANSNQILPTLWRDKIDMQGEIKQLEQDLALSGKLDLTQRRLFDENNRLRSLLGATSTNRTLATVVGRPGELPYDLIQIDRGSQAGIESGSPVYIGTDTVIGVVSSVKRNSAFVTLFTTPDFFATVYLPGANVTALLEGLGGGIARVRVPQGVPIRENDLVYVLSTQPGVFGTIAWVESVPTQPEQFGFITPEIPIGSLFQVSVAKPDTITTNPESARQYMLDVQNRLLVIPEITPATTTESVVDTATSTDEL